MDMELRSYQRAFLRSKAQQLDPVVYVGKDGFTPGVVGALDEALTAHELVKVMRRMRSRRSLQSLRKLHRPRLSQ